MKFKKGQVTFFEIYTHDTHAEASVHRVLILSELTEPSHEIMVPFILHKLILQMRMCSHLLGLGV